jgi:hypothetical protein
VVIFLREIREIRGLHYPKFSNPSNPNWKPNSVLCGWKRCPFVPLRLCGYFLLLDGINKLVSSVVERIILLSCPKYSC